MALWPFLFNIILANEDDPHAVMIAPRYLYSLACFVILSPK